MQEKRAEMAKSRRMTCEDRTNSVSKGVVLLRLTSGRRETKWALSALWLRRRHQEEGFPLEKRKDGSPWGENLTSALARAPRSSGAGKLQVRVGSFDPAARRGSKRVQSSLDSHVFFLHFFSLLAV